MKLIATAAVLKEVPADRATCGGSVPRRGSPKSVADLVATSARQHLPAPAPGSPRAEEVRSCWCSPAIEELAGGYNGNASSGSSTRTIQDYATDRLEPRLEVSGKG